MFREAANASAGQLANQNGGRWLDSSARPPSQNTRLMRVRPILSNFFCGVSTQVNSAPSAMDSSEFTSLREKLTSATKQVTLTTGQLSAEDLNFHRASDTSFGEQLDEQGDRLLALTSAVLKAATRGTDLETPVLKDRDSVDDNWRGVVDVIDQLLEKADACLDEFTGVIKKLSPSQEEQAKNAPPPRKNHALPSTYDYGPSKIRKPQLDFEHKPDNSDLGPFQPLLQSKPHAIVPLQESTKLKDFNGVQGVPLPYEAEIRAAQYPSWVYEKSTPIDYLPYESTTATFVNTFDGVKDMLADLKKAKEIAIDLEHHDVHSYHGLVSLMQISTREQDWVVDTLQPWREELQILNEVFADPSILKVLHGARSDIIWLQRDLGLYIVGMFDTFHAACALGLQKKSLKYLLHKYVNFEADKQYQMADWRLRPLPPLMFDYARSDTHFLLYIYDCLRNDLIEASTPDGNLIDYVLEGSKGEALQRYERPVYDAEHGQGQGGWYDLLTRTSGTLTREQFAVFKAVHKWRDEVAREVDEGLQCVFPKHVLFKLAHTLPTDMGTLLRTLSPVTPLTRERAKSLLTVIKEAKNAGADGPEWRDAAPPLRVLTQPVDVDLTNAPVAKRCETSQFWGKVLEAQESPVPPMSALVASAEALRLSLPLPRMPATVAEAREQIVTKPQIVDPAPNTAPAPVSQDDTASQSSSDAQEENKAFTVKELGGPRKRKVTPVAPEQDVMRLDVSDEEEGSKEERKRYKKARKEKKARAKEAKLQAASEAPFDYGAADSVLNSQNTSTAPSDSKHKHKHKKAYDPYAKLLEAPSGARKQKREIAGKSHTFR